MPQVSAADLPRMGASFDRILVLGARALPGAARQGKVSPCGHPKPGVQMDPHPVSLLETAPALRRISLSTCPCGSAPKTAGTGSTCGTTVEKCRRLQQNRDCWGLTERLRCLR